MAQSACRVLAVVSSVVFAAAVPAAVCVSAQDMRPAEQVYKNIKVMTGVPASEVNQGMHLIKASLGVECAHCHIEGQWDRDDVPMKATARRMYQMLTDINRTQFGGRAIVTCFTCHKGQAIPADMPSLPVPVKAEAGEAAKAVLPAADQVLAKYVAALGGEPAMRKVTTRVITATQDIPTGPGGTIATPVDGGERDREGEWA